MPATHGDGMMLASALVLASGLLIAYFAWRQTDRQARRIRHISRTLEQIAGGELQARVDVQPASRLGVLEEGINRLACSLQAHRDELEIRIADATADLLAKKEEAERANISKTRFLAAASHDLRQPLHALSLFSEVLDQKLCGRADGAELSTLSGQIASSVSSMQALLNALLDVSRLDANIIEVRRRHFCADLLLEKIRHQYAESARGKGIDLRIRACGATLHTDPVLLERILLNLVSNAIRYTQAGGVLVGCRRHAGRLCIQVWDTGIGIPDESRQSVFEEFVQLDNPERDRNNGLGLGLAIVARMAALLGHRISLRSQPGRGSMFEIELPAGLPKPPGQGEIPPLAGPKLEGRLGVLIDDDESVLGAMKQLFNAWNISFVAATDPAGAMEQLQSAGRVPDFLISDYRLGGDADGTEAAALLRGQFGADLPTLILTGDTAPGTLQRISQAGFAILHKPVKPARLRAMLMHLLG